MKQSGLFFLLMAALLLTGCSKSGIGDKVIVKAIYLEQSETYTASLLTLRSEPSADTGEVTEQAYILTGEGANLFEALAAAEQSENKQIFYGQNELLLLGPKLARQGLFEACRYLAAETSGRPNMAVYAVDLSPQEFSATEEKGKAVVESIQQLEKKGYYKTYLYQLGAAQQNGVLPCISLAEGKAAPLGLQVYKQGRPQLLLQNAQTELATLLAGQRRNLQLELELEAGPIRFTVRSPRLLYESERQGGEPTLSVCFTGHIQKLTTPEGAVTPGPDRELERQINAAMNKQLSGLADATFGQGNDVFELAAFLRNQDAAACRAMEANGSLWAAQRVRFESRLHIV